MNQILGELGKSQKFKELLNQIENKQSPIAISGLNDGEQCKLKQL